MKSFAWSWMAFTTLGWQWPVEATPMPALPGHDSNRQVSCRATCRINLSWLTTGHVKMLLAVCSPHIAAFSPFSNEVLCSPYIWFVPGALAMRHAEISIQTSCSDAAYRILPDWWCQPSIELFHKIFATRLQGRRQRPSHLAHYDHAGALLCSVH